MRPAQFGRRCLPFLISQIKPSHIKDILPAESFAVSQTIMVNVAAPPLFESGGY